MFSRGTRDPSTPGLRGPHPIRFGGHRMRGPRYSPSSGRRCPFRMCWPSWTWGRCPLRWGLCSPSRRSIGRIEGVSRGSGLERRRAVSSASGRVCVRWQWTTTLAPGLASATEKARPRLFRAPVTRATLPASSWSSVLFHALRRHAGGRPVEIPLGRQDARSGGGGRGGAGAAQAPAGERRCPALSSVGRGAGQSPRRAGRPGSHRGPLLAEPLRSPGRRTLPAGASQGSWRRRAWWSCGTGAPRGCALPANRRYRRRGR